MNFKVFWPTVTVEGSLSRLALGGWLVGWLTGWLVGWLVGWSVGWLVGWLVGPSVGWLVGFGPSNIPQLTPNNPPTPPSKGPIRLKRIPNGLQRARSPSSAGDPTLWTLIARSLANSILVFC